MRLRSILGWFLVGGLAVCPRGHASEQDFYLPIDEAEPLVCRDPVRAVCGSAGAQAVESSRSAQEWETLRERVLSRAWTALGLAGEGAKRDLSRIQLDPALFARWLQEVDKSVLAELPAGFKKDKLLPLVMKVHARLLQILEEDPRFASRKNQLRLSLERTQLVGLEEYLKFSALFGPNQEDVLSDILFACGGDGLAENLLHTRFTGEQTMKDPKTGKSRVLPAIAGNRIALCPGKLLRVAWDSRQESRLARGVAHEMAHALDLFGAFEGYDVSSKKLVSGDFRAIYQPLRKCIREKFSEALLEPKPNPILEAFGGGTAGRDELEKALGERPSSSDLYLNEIIADAWSNRISHVLFVGESALLESVRGYCASVGDLGEGSHPDGKFRIEALFGEPSVRRAVGCRSPSARPLCSL